MSIPDGWPTGEQFTPRAEPDDIDLLVWEEAARNRAHTLPLGECNWPVMVRSLIIEVRRLRGVSC